MNLHSDLCSVLIADSLDERFIITTLLHQSGIDIQTLSAIEQMAEGWSEETANLILLIQNDGLLHGIRTIRRITSVPLLIITEPCIEDDCVSYYQAGADLVVMRPYSLRILICQALMLARRGRHIPSSHLPAMQLSHISAESATRKIVLQNGQEVLLTQREFQIFFLLYEHQGQILTSEQIIERVWGFTGKGDINLLRTYIARLRAKLNDRDDANHIIQTIAGIGYTFKGEK